MRLRARKMSKGSLFKLIFISSAIPLFPFFVLCGIASLFGANTVKVNNAPVTGPMGLVAAMVMYPLFALLFTCFAWLFGAFGLWVYSKIRPLELNLTDVEILGDEIAQQGAEGDALDPAPLLSRYDEAE